MVPDVEKVWAGQKTFVVELTEWSLAVEGVDASQTD
jgi:hypothetical protein